MMSTLMSLMARPNCVTPAPPRGSGAVTRNTLGLAAGGHRFGGPGHYVLVVEPDAAQPSPFVSVRFEIRAEP
jgi:hypothetical protein